LYYGKQGREMLFGFIWPEAGAVYLITEPTTTYKVSQDRLSPKQWYHLALTWGDGGMRLLLDGSEVGSNPYREGPPAMGPDCPFSLGHGNFEGVIDEVRVWRTVRSEAQVRQTLFEHLNGREEGLLG